jgi:IS5 family transposase
MFGVKPTTAVADLGFRGVDDEVAPVQVIHRGKNHEQVALDNTASMAQGPPGDRAGHRHAKLDYRMDRCCLSGAAGNALHAVLCAAGFNIRWL